MSSHGTLSIALSTTRCNVVPIQASAALIGTHDSVLMECAASKLCISLHGPSHLTARVLVLERVAQIPLVVAGTYDTYDSVSHGMNKNYDARLHDRNLASANNSSDGGFHARI